MFEVSNKSPNARSEDEDAEDSMQQFLGLQVTEEKVEEEAEEGSEYGEEYYSENDEAPAEEEANIEDEEVEDEEEVADEEDNSAANLELLMFFSGAFADDVEKSQKTRKTSKIPQEDKWKLTKIKINLQEILDECEQD